MNESREAIARCVWSYPGSDFSAIVETLDQRPGRSSTTAPGWFAPTGSNGSRSTAGPTTIRPDWTTAHYALETDSDRADDPIRLNPTPFADRADAVAYVEAVEYLTTDDIVGLDDFDRELASQYRSRFVEEA